LRDQGRRGRRGEIEAREASLARSNSRAFPASKESVVANASANDISTRFRHRQNRGVALLRQVGLYRNFPNFRIVRLSNTFLRASWVLGSLPILNSRYCLERTTRHLSIDISRHCFTNSAVSSLRLRHDEEYYFSLVISERKLFSYEIFPVSFHLLQSCSCESFSSRNLFIFHFSSLAFLYYSFM